MYICDIRFSSTGGCVIFEDIFVMMQSGQPEIGVINIDGEIQRLVHRNSWMKTSRPRSGWLGSWIRVRPKKWVMDTHSRIVAEGKCWTHLQNLVLGRNNLSI